MDRGLLTAGSGRGCLRQGRLNCPGACPTGIPNLCSETKRKTFDSIERTTFNYQRRIHAGCFVVSVGQKCEGNNKKSFAFNPLGSFRGHSVSNEIQTESNLRIFFFHNTSLIDTECVRDASDKLKLQQVKEYRYSG